MAKSYRRMRKTHSKRKRHNNRTKRRGRGRRGGRLPKRVGGNSLAAMFGGGEDDPEEGEVVLGQE